MDRDRLEQALTAVRQRGGRVTATRRLVLEALLASDDHHQTASDVLRAVETVDPRLHRATVYRTLDLLTELGVLEHVHLGHGAAVYHLADQLHQHLVCDGCGAVVEVPVGVLDPLAHQLQRDYGFAIEPGHFPLTGRCAACK